MVHANQWMTQPKKVDLKVNKGDLGALHRGKGVYKCGMYVWVTVCMSV